MGAVFNELNRGEAVTAGLKKVDPSQMTHKNPSLRANAPVPTRSDSTGSIGRSKSPAPPGKKPKPESMRTKKPPRKELDGNKWIIVSSNPTSNPALCLHSPLYLQIRRGTFSLTAIGIGQLRFPWRHYRNRSHTNSFNPHFPLQEHHDPHCRQSKRHLGRQQRPHISHHRLARQLCRRHQMPQFCPPGLRLPTHSPAGPG